MSAGSSAAFDDETHDTGAEDVGTDEADDTDAGGAAGGAAAPDHPVPPTAIGGTAARRARQATSAAPLRTGAAVRRPTARPVVPRADRALQRELDPDRLATLEEERDFLLRSLADLEREHDVGDVDEHDYLALKDDYTVRAAATLRAIESRQATLDAVRPPRSRARVWGGVAIVVLVALGLGVFVAASAGRRGSDDTLSGDTRQTSRDQLLQAESIMSTDPKGALDLFDQVLRTAPDNTEALTYKGWLLKLASGNAESAADRQGFVASALVSLSRAVDVDPTYADARVFRAILYKDEGQFAAAQADLDALDTAAVPPFMADRVTCVRKQVSSGMAGGPADESVCAATP